MIEIKSGPAELCFLVSVTRAATGLVETYSMVGHIESTTTEESQELDNGTLPLDHGA